ncbi:hypothetical protein BC827DRAFT_378414 [Russula dissimulans]|nr:hypothetical protein BC827DRAFT_378414 [Russula dissimulans]
MPWVRPKKRRKTYSTPRCRNINRSRRGMGGKSRVGKHFSGKGDHNGLGNRTLQSLATQGKYLPDHVFVAAFSKPKSENDVQRSQTMPKTRLPRSRKRRSVQACTKDVVVGTRTVRTSFLSFPANTRSQSSGTTLPPARINKFLANALGLKARNKRISALAPRWERRPPHLGVIKRTTGAPVTGFAHSSRR